jgi:hypothetical protein
MTSTASELEPTVVTTTRSPVETIALEPRAGVPRKRVVLVTLKVRVVVWPLGVTTRLVLEMLDTVPGT